MSAATITREGTGARHEGRVYVVRVDAIYVGTYETLAQAKYAAVEARATTIKRVQA